MTVKIPLRLRGLDLRDIEAYDRIDATLDELSWEANGGVSLATFYSDDPSSIAMTDAADSARRIAKLMRGVSVAEVHDELVSLSDIALRAGVAAEAVRLWAVGKRRASLRPFPDPRQVVSNGSGGKAMNLYAWREVLSWIRDVVHIDPDGGIEYLTDAELAMLNAELADIALSAVWQPIIEFSIETERVIVDVQQLCGKEGCIGFAGTRFAQIVDDISPVRRHPKLCIA